jgi:hypothetical protein
MDTQAAGCIKTDLARPVFSRQNSLGKSYRIPSVFPKIPGSNDIGTVENPRYSGKQTYREFL